MIELVERVRVAAPAERTWQELTDWASQGEWMLATDVRVCAGDGASEGSRIAAFTGFGPLAVTDTMEITEWRPPARCAVAHIGDVVRGVGVFEVHQLAAGDSECVWTERLELPFGMFGRAGWLAVGPMFRGGLRLSLHRFAARVAG
ncbi:MAG: SRPBCC family protein [Pseudonocardiaceae bacterium]|nr:SRPBCC family protein [Pseudonocardiaceae bacterium]